MPEKDPLNYSVLTYAWVISLSSWGGIVSFYRKMQSGRVRPFNLTEFVGEIVTSGLTGIITFFLCEHGGIDPLLTAALVGVSGHMGSRALSQLEYFLMKRAGIQDDQSPTR